MPLLDQVRQQRPKTHELGRAEHILLEKRVPLEMTPPAVRIFINENRRRAVNVVVAKLLELRPHERQGARGILAKVSVLEEEVGQVFDRRLVEVAGAEEEGVVRGLAEGGEEVLLGGGVRRLFAAGNGEGVRGGLAGLVALVPLLSRSEVRGEEVVVDASRGGVKGDEVKLSCLGRDDLSQHLALPPPQHERSKQLLELTVRSRVIDLRFRAALLRAALSLQVHKVFEHPLPAVVALVVAVVSSR